MGTINYFTSDVITLVFDENNVDTEYIKDVLTDYGEEYPRDDVEQWKIDDYIQECIDDRYNIVESRLDDAETFYYFKIEIKSGYYDGVQIIIEDLTKYGFDDSQEKRDALKEVNRLKNLLHLITAHDGFIACSPSWCSAYYSENQTHARIDTAIKELKSRIRKEVVTA